MKLFRYVLWSEFLAYDSHLLFANFTYTTMQAIKTEMYKKIGKYHHYCLSEIVELDVNHYN